LGHGKGELLSSLSSHLSLICVRFVSSKIYLLAWTHAKSQTASSNVDQDSSVVKALKELIENWTMPEFVQFVDRIEKEVEKLDLKEGSEAWDRCEEVSFSSSILADPESDYFSYLQMFKYNLLLEQQFWPEL
jgi:hypothetical protein